MSSFLHSIVSLRLALLLLVAMTNLKGLYKIIETRLCLVLVQDDLMMRYIELRIFIKS
jgi:hypothetical protein